MSAVKSTNKIPSMLTNLMIVFLIHQASLDVCKMFRQTYVSRIVRCYPRGCFSFSFTRLSAHSNDGSLKQRLTHLQRSPRDRWRNPVGSRPVTPTSRSLAT